MASYVALIRKGKRSYGADFPDFPGCVSAGRTLDEARAMAAEALAFHIDGMAEDGDVIPEPSTLEAIMAAPENRDAVAVLVDLPDRATRAVRINMTVSARDLKAIDAHAEARGLTRSGFLVRAAKQAMRKGRAA
jgi:predicted RNase H-like HicB family nuclease